MSEDNGKSASGCDILIRRRAIAAFVRPRSSQVKTARGPTSSRKKGIFGPLAVKRAADSRARALASTLRELMAAGFVSQPALANELNRRKTPTRLGGKWHPTTVARVLARLGLVANGRINNGLSHKRAAEVRARALAPTIRKLRRAGIVSSRAIARELNEREIPTARDGKWDKSTVKRHLRRLEKAGTAHRF
jgi:DNA-binding HxlR family transcriptional regulator